MTEGNQKATYVCVNADIGKVLEQL